jgi:hypothetical protein
MSPPPVSTAATGVRCPGCDDETGSAPVLLRGRDRLTGAPGEFSVLSCPGCGLAFTEPRLRPEDFDTYYPETYSAYEPNARPKASQGERNGVQRRERQDFVARNSWAARSGEVLDLALAL